MARRSAAELICPEVILQIKLKALTMEWSIRREPVYFIMELYTIMQKRKTKIGNYFINSYQ